LQFSYIGDNVEVQRYEDGQLVSKWVYVVSAVTGVPSPNRRLKQVKHAGQVNVVTDYEYYTDGPDARKGLIKKITEPNGETHSYEYYSNGRVFRVTDGN
jgi:YD repeat-containing protein